MSRLKIIDQGVLFRNPLPGHQAVIAYAPAVLPLSDNELIATFRHGQAMYSRDGMVHQLRSSDGGKSWEHEGQVTDRSMDRVHFNYRSAELTLLRDGSIVMRIDRADHDDESKLYTNPETGGLLPGETTYWRSGDGGRSWSEPVVAQLPEEMSGCEPAADGPVIELNDGRWMQIFETWNKYDDGGPLDIKTLCVFSDDEGQTWGDLTIVADGKPFDRSYSHGHFVQREDGSLFGVCWTSNSQYTEFFNNHTITSRDGGHTWGEPQPTTIHGQTSYPVDMGDGRIALVYSHREKTEQPGIKVVLSDDGGKTWDLDNHVVIWDAYGKEALGVPPTDTYPSAHDAIAYGAPHMTRLNENELMASFWCTQSADTHSRWIRLEIGT